MADLGFDCVFHQLAVRTGPKMIPSASRVTFSLDPLNQQISNLLNHVAYAERHKKQKGQPCAGRLPDAKQKQMPAAKRNPSFTDGEEAWKNESEKVIHFEFEL